MAFVRKMQHVHVLTRGMVRTVQRNDAHMVLRLTRLACHARAMVLVNNLTEAAAANMAIRAMHASGSHVTRAARAHAIRVSASASPALVAKTAMCARVTTIARGMGLVPLTTSALVMMDSLDRAVSSKFARLPMLLGSNAQTMDSALMAHVFALEDIQDKAVRHASARNLARAMVCVLMGRALVGKAFKDLTAQHQSARPRA